MIVSPGTPWDQYGLIPYLAERLGSVSPQFGKTALQKMVYLLQEIGQVPCGYEYTLHNHGPFSAELMSDLDNVAALAGVKVSVRDGGTRGFLIEPGAESLSLQSRAVGFLQKYGPAISSVIDRFGKFTAKDLELRSTIVYVHRDNHRRGMSASREHIVSQVREIKPHFAASEIHGAVDELVHTETLVL